MNATAPAGPMPVTLANLAVAPRWVAWQQEVRPGGKPTKVPYAPKGEKARADDPRTWGRRDAAEARAAILPKPYGMGGVGIELGAESDGRWLFGVDLDTCRNVRTGRIEQWAATVIEQLATYAEVSPSGTGIKAFGLLDPAAMPSLRAAMGTSHGKQFKRGGGEHPPAIELHVSNRYFAVTGEHLAGTSGELRPVSLDTLLWLVREAGPAFARRAGDSQASDDLLARIAVAAERNPALARRWAGDWTGLNDASGSGRAMALGAALRRAGFAEVEMRQTLHLHPDTQAWAGAKGEANGTRELRRVWDAAGRDAPYGQAGTQPFDQPPELGILNRTRLPAPPLPLDVFGPWWATWIGHAADGANAPPDYVVMSLLACASALIGNARWPRAWRGWVEPPVLWCASVGDPSSSKSAGAAPITRDVLRQVEARMARTYPDDIKRWQEVEAISAAVEKQWERDVATAAKNGDEIPAKPAEATPPPKPIRPRASFADSTVEKLAAILQGLPKGVLHRRDELAGWLQNLSRYNGGTDRPFWLEAYVGGPYQVDRQKHPEPLFVPHLAVPVFGTIQPERLDDVLSGADDGLGSRFLWSWPEAQPFRRPREAADVDAAAHVLGRLADLTMLRDAEGSPCPSYMSLTSPAADALEAFAGEMQAREGQTHGLLRSALGKARGQALRLALVLEYLWWCADPDPGLEPAEVCERAMLAAAGLMEGYFLPMAERVLGDASVPEEERLARTLAQWIARTRPAVVNVSAVRDGARLNGLRETGAVKQACRFLADARWLVSPEPVGQGRPRGDWPVNPALWVALDGAVS